MNFYFKNQLKKKPKRVIILGSSGIISRNLQKILKNNNINILTIGRSKINFKSNGAGKILASKFGHECT